MPKPLQQQLLLLLVVLALAGGSQAGRVVCNTSQLELAFAIDVSSSLTREDFASLKEFLNKIAASLPLGPTETRPAVISFSTNATVEFNLGEADSLPEFQRRVAAIPYYRGFTATGLAMQLARTRVFVNTRPKASKLLVVVTDGRTNKPGSRVEALQLVRDESARLLADGVRIHAVGVGGIWLEDELREIAGGEDFSMIDNYKALQKLVDTLVKEICDVHCSGVGNVTSLPGLCHGGTQRIVHVAKRHNEKLKRCEKAITYEYRYCGQSSLCKSIDVKVGECVNGQRAITTSWEDYDIDKQRCVLRTSVQRMDCEGIEECREPVAEIMFVLDSSQSLRIRDWLMQLMFVRDLVAKLRIGPSTIRVGVVVFGSNAWVDVKLGQISSRSLLVKRIKKLRRRSNQWTNLGMGLRMAASEIRQRARRDVRRVAVVMTDGESNVGPNVIQEAAALESLNVTILVLGIGSDLKKEELEAIATPPLSDHLFYPEDFQRLRNWAAKVSEETCEIIMPPDPSLCSLPPRRVVSSCYRGKRKVTEIRYQYDSTGACSKKLVSRVLDKCQLICSDPINGNQYVEGEEWRSECSSFQCGRQKQRTALKPLKEQCLAANGTCRNPAPNVMFQCHDEVGQLFSHCSCHAGVELNVITADANARRWR